jgi:hypothetical protein
MRPHATPPPTCTHPCLSQVSLDQAAKTSEKEAREHVRKTKEAAEMYAALQVQQSQLDELWHKYTTPLSPHLLATACLILNFTVHIIPHDSIWHGCRPTSKRLRSAQARMMFKIFDACTKNRDLEEQRQQAQQQRALRRLWEEKEKARKLDLQVRMCVHDDSAYR